MSAAAAASVPLHVNAAVGRWEVVNRLRDDAASGSRCTTMYTDMAANAAASSASRAAVGTAIHGFVMGA